VTTFLAATELFSGLDKSLLHKIGSVLGVIQVAPNEVLVRQGDTDGDLYLVVCGGLRVVTEHASGAEQILPSAL
jgi:CRP-like cAMP-binding protein